MILVLTSCFCIGSYARSRGHVYGTSRNISQIDLTLKNLI